MKIHERVLDKMSGSKIAAGAVILGIGFLTISGCGDDSKKLFEGAKAPAGLSFTDSADFVAPGSNGEVHGIKIYADSPNATNATDLLNDTDCGYGITNKSSYTNELGRLGVTCLKYVPAGQAPEALDNARDAVAQSQENNTAQVDAHTFALAG